MMLNKIRPSTDLRGILLAAGQVLSLIPSQCNRIFFFLKWHLQEGNQRLQEVHVPIIFLVQFHVLLIHL